MKNDKDISIALCDGEGKMLNNENRDMIRGERRGLGKIKERS
jgi:hypothetical protein